MSNILIDLDRDDWKRLMEKGVLEISVQERDYVIKQKNETNKFTVVEKTDSYIVCHGSGLSWAEAHLLVFSKLLEDKETYEMDTFKGFDLYELEANSPGLGVSYEFNGEKTTYYILDDPGNLGEKKEG